MPAFISRSALRVLSIALVVLTLITLAPVTPAAATIASGGPDTVAGNARGYLTSPQELRLMRTRANGGFSPYASNRSALLNHVGSPTNWSVNGTSLSSNYSPSVTCSDTNSSPSYLVQGGRLTYGKMLAAHVITDTAVITSYAEQARTRILSITLTSDWGGTAPSNSSYNYSGSNQCALYLSQFVPGYIMAADLLESFPSVWSATSKQTFRSWLATEVYPVVAWVSRVRQNNWGSAGSYAAAMIADYLWDSGLALEEYQPNRLTLTPAQAYAQHNAIQLQRMSTTWAGDSSCPGFGANIYGIQSYGGIPDELRRAYDNGGTSTQKAQACQWTSLAAISTVGSVEYGKAYNYQQLHIEAIVAHGEMLRRRNDNSIINYQGAGSFRAVVDAINFIIKNPVTPANSWPWDVNRKGTIWIVSRWYNNQEFSNDLSSSYTYPTGQTGSTGGIRAGEMVPFARLTFHYNPSLENPGGPAFYKVPAPGQIATSVAVDESFASSNLAWSTNGGTWGVGSGAYDLSTPATASSHNSNIAVHNALLGDNFALRTRVKVVGTPSAWNDLSVLFSYQDANNYAYASLNESNDSGTSGIFTVQNGVTTQIADIATPILADTWYTVQIIKTGATVQALLNSSTVATATSSAFGDGRVGFGTRNDSASFDDLLVYSFGSQFVEDFTNFSGWSTSGTGWQATAGGFTFSNSGGSGGAASLLSPALGRNSVTNLRVRIGNTASSGDSVSINLGTGNAGADPLVVKLGETGGSFVRGNTVVATIPAIVPGTWYNVQFIRAGRFIDVLLNGTSIASITIDILPGDTSAVSVSTQSSNSVEFNVLNVISVGEPTFY